MNERLFPDIQTLVAGTYISRVVFFYASSAAVLYIHNTRHSKLSIFLLIPFSLCNISITTNQ